MKGRIYRGKGHSYHFLSTHKYPQCIKVATPMQRRERQAAAGVLL